MESLERLEEKIDNMSLTGVRPASMSLASAGPSSSSHQTPGSVRSDRDDRIGTDVVPPILETAQGPPPYFAAPHRTVVWPVVCTEITRLVPHAAPHLAALSEGGTSWLLCVNQLGNMWSDCNSHVIAAWLAG